MATVANTFIPIVQYIRPHGERRSGGFQVPYDEKVEENIRKLSELGIEITAEEMFGNVNVCLDDGEFDYKFELFTNGSELPSEVTKLIRDFDEQDYWNKKELEQ